MSEAEVENVENVDLTASDTGDADSEFQLPEDHNGNNVQDAIDDDDDGDDGDDADIQALVDPDHEAPPSDASDPGDDGSEDGAGSDVGLDLNDDDIQEPRWKRRCLQSCKPPWNLLYDKYVQFRTLYLLMRERIASLKAENRDLRAQVGRQAEVIAQLQNRKRQKTEPTWPNLLEKWITHGPGPHCPPGIQTWEDAYKLTCRETNMSSHPNVTHPDLRFRSATDAEEANGMGVGFIRNPEEYQRQGIFPFEQLDFSLQLKILRLVLVHDGEMVHAISRLDPYHEPSQVPRNCAGKISLLHRFHVGTSRISVTFATDPQAMLAPLSGRFAAGIKQRLQRIQDIEILWTGSQQLTYQPNIRGKFRSRRTVPLTWLGEASRLKTLIVHVQESSPSYIRRKHEPRGIIRYMRDKTEQQPNFRLFRSLRTLQGLDYINMLRGMETVSFFDYDKWIENKVKAPVRDFTFVMDVNNAVRRPKSDRDLKRSKFRNLALLIPDYRPRAEDRLALEKAIERKVPSGEPLTPPPEPDLSGTEDSQSNSGSDSDHSDDDSGGGSDRPDDGGLPEAGPGGRSAEGSGGADSTGGNTDSSSNNSNNSDNSNNSSDNDSDDDDSNDAAAVKMDNPGDRGLPSPSSSRGAGADSSAGNDTGRANDGGSGVNDGNSSAHDGSSGIVKSDSNDSTEERELGAVSQDGSEMEIRYDFNNNDKRFPSHSSEGTPARNELVIDLTGDNESESEPEPEASMQQTDALPNVIEAAPAQVDNAQLRKHTPIIQKQEEPENGAQNPEGSLFCLSPRGAEYAQYLARMDTPFPQHNGLFGIASSSTANRLISTPIRETREESSMFMSGTPYSQIVRSRSARGSRFNTRAPTSGSDRPADVIDLTTENIQRKRSWDRTSDEESELESESDANSPKRPRF
ncbi:hypothetical protein QQZ08_005097 [Neonectria magnoliae]|uniref:Uncharacterized protein n=1 Tax=Neonectria magnoliae TaxID=2732573 RepID=A0ABR1I467_9HYPO